MIYKILADLIIIVHFTWILFMLLGFFWTVYAILFSQKFFQRWVFRTLHLLGIFYVGSLSLLGQVCPLTIWENSLRAKYDPSQVYSGSFIVHYIENLVYPELDVLVIKIATLFIAVFSISIYILKPPQKIKNFLKSV